VLSAADAEDLVANSDASKRSSTQGHLVATNPVRQNNVGTLARFERDRGERLDARGRWRKAEADRVEAASRRKSFCIDARDPDVESPTVFGALIGLEA
jgi:hypothetical protein